MPDWRHWPSNCANERRYRLCVPRLVRLNHSDFEVAESKGTRRTITMAWLIRKLRIPASESSMGIVLTLCVVAMGLMSMALIWQAQIIANQREAIRWLESLKFGG